MSQLTFTGEMVPLRRDAPTHPLGNSHRIVLSIFNGASELTYQDIEKRLAYRIRQGEIQETANRARDLAQWGYLTKTRGDDGKTRFKLPRRT